MPIQISTALQQPAVRRTRVSLSASVILVLNYQTPDSNVSVSKRLLQFYAVKELSLPVRASVFFITRSVTRMIENMHALALHSLLNF